MDVYSVGVDALIDTGATLNYISHALCMEILAVQPALELNIDTNRVVKVANNSVVSCHGEITLPISIDNKMFSVNFLVLDTLLFSMILGFQYCKLNQVVIDASEGAIHFKNHCGYYQLSLDAPVDPSLCCLVESLTIPAFSERLVDIRVPFKTDGTYLFTKESSLLPSEGLGVADGIVQFRNGIGVVAIANLSGKAVKTRAGLLVGRVGVFYEDEFIIDDPKQEDESVLASVGDVSVASGLGELLKEVPGVNVSVDNLNNEQFKPTLVTMVSAQF